MFAATRKLFVSARSCRRLVEVGTEISDSAYNPKGKASQLLDAAEAKGV